MSAISAKLSDKELIVIRDTKLDTAKTKNVAKIVDALKMDGKKVLFISEAVDLNFVRSVNNIPNACVIPASQLSVLDIVNNKFLVASVGAIKNIEEAYK